jgi:hypothetical protein
MPKKKKNARADAAVAATEPQQLPVKILIDPSEEQEVYYANYAEASFGQYECLVSFARVPTKLNSARTEEAKGGTLRIEPLVQIMISPALLQGLIQALVITKESYERMSDQNRDQEAPK